MINFKLLFDLRFYAVIFQTYWFISEDQYEEMGAFLPANRTIRKYIAKLMADIRFSCVCYQATIQSYLGDYRTRYDSELDLLMEFYYLNPHFKQIHHIKSKLENNNEVWDKWDTDKISNIEDFIAEHVMARYRLLTEIEIFENIRAAAKKARSTTKKQRIQDGIKFIKRSPN